MDIPQGSKFIFFIIPVFVIAIAVVIFIFSGKTQLPVNNHEPINEEDIFGSQEDDNDFGMLVRDTLREGEGREAEDGDELTVNYVGTLKDGTQFDSSYDRGQPYTFILGIGEVIQGWDQGLYGMKVGEKRRLQIPSSLGYGETGSGIIPANAGLIFEVELVSID
jgi:hypothetical protein